MDRRTGGASAPTDSIPIRLGDERIVKRGGFVDRKMGAPLEERVRRRTQTGAATNWRDWV
jgi:hypothetical protein